MKKFHAGNGIKSLCGKDFRAYPKRCVGRTEFSAKADYEKCRACAAAYQNLTRTP